MDRALTVGLEAVNRTIEGKAAGLASTLRSAVAEAAQGMEGEATRTTELLGKTGQQFAEDLNAKSDEFTRTMDERSSQIVTRVAEAQNRLATQAAAVAQTFSEAGNAIVNKVAEAETIVGTQVNAISKALSDAGQSLEARGDAIRTTLSGAGSEISATMADVDRALEARSSAIRSNLEERVREIDTTLSDIDRALEARGNSIRSTLEERTRDLNSMLSGRSVELTRILDETARPIIDRYTDAGEQAAARITAAANLSADRLRAENEALASAVAARTENVANAVSAIENSLVGNVNGLVQRMSESSAAMAMMMNRAAEQLTSVDGRLGETTTRFADSATKAAEMVNASTRLLEGKVDRLSDISGQTLAQVGGIIGRFDEHSKVLTQASQLLGAAQSNLASTLEEREGALQALSVSLVQRSDEIEKTMRGLGSMIETVFERAEQRSNQVTSSLRQGVQSSFADIGRILTETEKRAQEAAETMREAITRAGDEANTTIDSTFANVERVPAISPIVFVAASPPRCRKSSACSARPAVPPTAPPSTCANRCARRSKMPSAASPALPRTFAAPPRTSATSSTPPAPN